LYSEARFWAFADRTNENHQDYLGRGNFIFRPGRRLELNGGISYEDTEDPSTSEQQSVTGPRTPRTQLIGSLGGKWTFSPKTRFSLAGDFTEDRFKRVVNNRLEKNTFRVTAEGFRQIFPKTSVVLGYTFGGTDFTNRPRPPDDFNDDSLTHTVLAGIDLDPTAKLSGRLSAGATLRDFDQPGRDNEVDVGVETELIYRPLARTTLGLLLRREFADTSAVGEFAAVRTIFLITGNQALTEKLALNLSAEAVSDDFVKSDRDDVTYTVNGGVIYQLLRWLGVGFQYQYEKKDSDVDVNDYEQSQFIFIIAGRF
ncbi:MAG: outer membrane beta-barrel protein, partial [Nitrospinota bacterium]